MAAIREAGGAGKLKSARVKHSEAVKEQKEQKSSPKPPPGSTSAGSAAPAGDLMADLFNKLAMRRKVGLLFSSVTLIRTMRPSP